MRPQISARFSIGFHMKYIPLTNLVFSVRTVSQRPNFFPLVYGPITKRAGYKSTGKIGDP